MKKLIALFLFVLPALSSAQVHSPDYVGMVYDIPNDRVWPKGADNYITNNRVIRFLLAGGTESNFVRRTGDTMTGKLSVLDSFEQGSGVSASGPFSHAQGLQYDTYAWWANQFVHDGTEFTGPDLQTYSWYTTLQENGRYGCTNAGAKLYAGASNNFDEVELLGWCIETTSTGKRLYVRTSPPLDDYAIFVAAQAASDGIEWHWNDDPPGGDIDFPSGQQFGWALLLHQELSGGIGGTAAGEGAHVEGIGSDAPGKGAHAEGERTEASGLAAHSDGLCTSAQGAYSRSGGIGSIAEHDISYVWSGRTALTNELGVTLNLLGLGDTVSVSNRYKSHGPGTFNIDPEGGAAGFWIGEKTLQEYLSGISELGSYVVKTNGEWVIVQTGDWTGIEYGGERVFGAVLEVHSNSAARITGLYVPSPDSLLLQFRGAETNHLESCSDRETWETWDDCDWLISDPFDGTGSVLVQNADPDCWYRVVAEGYVPSWSNVSVVSYSPMYVFDGTNMHRVATVDDADEIASRRTRSVSVRGVSARQFENPMYPDSRDLAWDFNSDGPYIRYLTVGGQELQTTVVTTNDGVVTTNTVTITNFGSITLNGVTWKKFPDLGGMVFEEVTDDGAGNIVTNTWTNAGVLELDGVVISNWNQLRKMIGNGFPLQDPVDFNNQGASNIPYFAWAESPTPYTDGNILYFDGEKLMLGTNEVGSGSLESVWGPSTFTNQESFSTNLKAKSLGMLPAETDPNIRIVYDPTNSVYYFQAYSTIPGPQGADGPGNILWAGTYRNGMIVSNENTWVGWNGSIWTREPSSEPVTEVPTNSQFSTWQIVVSRGKDGIVGSPGKDGVGLHFVEWSTNILVFETNDLISAGGYLLMITNDVATPNPGNPIGAGGLPTAKYKTIVRPGRDGTSGDLYTNLFFAVEFNADSPYPAHSLVVYQDYLWYARQDYIPRQTTLPTSGDYWICIGRQGERGAEGLNGIGNLFYKGHWDEHKTYNINDIVRYVSPDGKADWYRAMVEPLKGPRPNVGTNYWSKEITSGRDGYNMEWHFVDGPYDPSVQHSNELHRMPDGRVWYSVGVVDIGDGYAPGVNASKWRLLVKDGVAISGEGGSTIWRGTWSQGGSYDPGDIVTWEHAGGKGLFICENAVTNGAAPTDTRYWLEIAAGLKGTDGKNGTATNTVYNVTNIVTYSNAEFVTYTTNLVNTNTTAILDYDLGTPIPEVKMSPQHFYWNETYKMFSLTASALGVGTFNGMQGPVGILPGSGISFSTNNQQITISAAIDFSSLAKQSDFLSVSNKVANLSPAFDSVSNTVSQIPNNYVTTQGLTSFSNSVYNAMKAMNTTVVTNAGVTNTYVITNSAAAIAELRDTINGLAPVISTPDGKRWKAVGVYAENGKPTFSWVEHLGDYGGAITLDMPDNRHFRMVGTYVDGDTNKVSFSWEAVGAAAEP